MGTMGVLDAAARRGLVELPEALPRRGYSFAASEASKLVGEAARRFWWHSAHHYAACLRAALRHAPERVEGWRRHLGPAGAAGLGRTAAAEFEPFVREVCDWARGTNPWQQMPPEAAETLAAGNWAAVRVTFEMG